MSRRVLIHVQHLLGIGHLKRAAILARACAEEGLEVTLLSGGAPVHDLDLGGARLLQLAPARVADHTFRALLNGDGRPVEAAWEARRRERSLAALAELRPHVVVLEMFPFGRRRFAFELLPLLEAAAGARPRPRILCSLRDILVTKARPGRNEEIAERVEAWFDHVLVHADPSLVRLDRTYPLAPRLAERIVYTGYVAEAVAPAPGPDAPGRGEVIVSSGGGAVGERLLACAMEARERTSLRRAPWRVLAGSNLDRAAFRALEARAPAGVVVERARADFPSLVANCTLSISQAGYNTITALMRGGARAVVTPFAAGKENEQSLRAELLRGRGALQVVDERSLGPATLAGAVEAAMAGAGADVAGVDLSGAETSARLIAGWAEKVAA